MLEPNHCAHPWRTATASSLAGFTTTTSAAAAVAAASLRLGQMVKSKSINPLFLSSYLQNRIDQNFVFRMGFFWDVWFFFLPGKGQKKGMGGKKGMDFFSIWGRYRKSFS